MTAKAKVKKIVVQIGPQTLELTPDEAKELHKTLDDLVGPRQDARPQVPTIRWPQVWNNDLPLYQS